MLHTGKVVSVIVASRDMIEKRREELKRFLTGFYLSWWYYANNPQAMNQQFLKDSKLGFSENALNKAASIEPNLDARSLTDINMVFSEEDFKVVDLASTYLLQRGAIKKVIDVRQSRYLDTSLIYEVIDNAEKLKDLLSKIHEK